MITFLPVGGFWSAAPVTFLSTARVELIAGTSLDGGISPPLFRGDGFFVLPPEWTEAEVETFAAMWVEIPVTLVLTDKDTDALLAKLNSNVVSTTSPQ